MKTTKYFFMAALALMTAACSNEDNAIEQQPQMARGIPFTATIGIGESAATRALIENSDGYIVGTWEENDLVALIYKVGNTSYKAEAKVTSVSNYKATLSGELRSDAVNGSDVTIIYPASAADGITGNVDNSILTTQDGTLTGNDNSLDKTCDVRTGTGKLSISGAEGYKTATVNKGTAGTYVELTNYYAILKFSIQDVRGTSAANFKATEFKVTCPNPLLCRKFTPNTATGELYIALPNETSLPQGAYWLNATINEKPYVGKVKVATASVLEKGKFYSTTVQMATVGDYVLSSGKYAAGTITVDPEGDPVVAQITYVVDAGDAAVDNHGLALALADQGDTGKGFSTPTAARISCKSRASVNDASWDLPTKPQWQLMISQASQDKKYTNMRANNNLKWAYYMSSTEQPSPTTSPTPVGVVMFNDTNQNNICDSDEEAEPWYWNNVYTDIYVRACLVF